MLVTLLHNPQASAEHPPAVCWAHLGAGGGGEDTCARNS